MYEQTRTNQKYFCPDRRLAHYQRRPDIGCGCERQMRRRQRIAPQRGRMSSPPNHRRGIAGVSYKWLAGGPVRRKRGGMNARPIISHSSISIRPGVLPAWTRTGADAPIDRFCVTPGDRTAEPFPSRLGHPFTYERPTGLQPPLLQARRAGHSHSHRGQHCHPIRQVDGQGGSGATREAAEAALQRLGG
jgi:hypothetical protein